MVPAGVWLLEGTGGLESTRSHAVVEMMRRGFRVSALRDRLRAISWVAEACIV